MDYIDILKNFKLSVSDAEIYFESTLTGGHINGTKLISLSSGKYILQTINQSVFHDINILEDNLREIRKCFNDDSSDKDFNPVSIPNYIEDISGALITQRSSGAYRLYPYITPCNEADIDINDRIKISAFAFGKYISMISDCLLRATIPCYHDPDHYSKLLRTAITNNSLYEKYDDMLDKISKIENIVQRSLPAFLPMRNIHGDASVKNIIITDHNTGAAVVIDLDTSFPGYAASDFGDLVRSSLDLIRKSYGKKVLSDSLIIQTIKDITSAYLRGTDQILTQKEIHSLIPGIIRVDCELAMRYLTDAISHSSYFDKTPEECMERASDLIDDALCIIRIKNNLSVSYDL